MVGKNGEIMREGQCPVDTNRIMYIKLCKRFIFLFSSTFVRLVERDGRQLGVLRCAWRLT